MHGRLRPFAPACRKDILRRFAIRFIEYAIDFTSPIRDYLLITSGNRVS